MKKDPDRTYGRRTLPVPTKIMAFIGMGILVVGTPFACEKTPLFDLVGVWLLGSAIFGFLAYLDLGHRISWDKEHIWLSRESITRIFRAPPETSVRIADIEWVEGQFDGNADTKAKFFPFDYMVVFGETVGPEPYVMINPHFIHVTSVRELLHHIEHHKPGVLAPEVIAFMHSDKPF